MPRGLARGAGPCRQVLAAAYAIAPGRPAGAAIESAAADPPGDPAVEAPTEEASEVKRYASDEPFGGEASECETAAAPAAEDEDGSAAEGAGFPDVPLEVAEVESPPIVPVELDEDRPRIDIEAANLAERSIGPAMDVESVAARRFRLDLGSRPRWPLSHLQTLILALVIADASVVVWRTTSFACSRIPPRSTP